MKFQLRYIGSIMFYVLILGLGYEFIFTPEKENITISLKVFYALLMLVIFGTRCWDIHTDKK